MELAGKYEIPAAPDVVWDALYDPETLKACIPGCEAIEKVSPTEFLATATLKIGPMKATFKGKVALSELDPPRRCVLRGEGQGGAAGFAKGQAEVLLIPDGEGTVLNYTAKASIGGKLAQIGQRLIDGAARQIADDFFGHFAQRLTQRKTEPVAAEPEALPEGKERPAIPRLVWVVGLTVLVLILLLMVEL